MKIVINNCFGGFSISPLAVKRMAELKGKPCYFFVQNISEGLHGQYIPATIEEAEKSFMFWAFAVENPNDYFHKKDWNEMTLEERKEENELYSTLQIDNREYDRHDPLLVQVVEELGKKASGKCADLKIVEIPDNTDYEIQEYDGNEHIAEKHRTWS